MNSNIKSENVDFNVFSVDQLDETNLFQSVKSEPRVCIGFSNISRKHSVSHCYLKKGD